MFHGMECRVDRSGLGSENKKVSIDGESLKFLRDLPPAGNPRFWEISPGRRIAWNEYGDPEGRVVMYYHGWPSSRLQARLAHHLARERGLRLVALDRPGMGRSSFVAGRTLKAWPELVADFADAHGIGRFGQLGVSGGGPYVLACAALLPERLTGSAVLGGAVPMAEIASGRRGLHPIYRMLIPFRKLPCGVFSALFRMAALASRWHPGWPPLSWLLRSLPPEDRALLAGLPEVWEVITRSFREGVGNARGVMTDAEIYLQRLGFDPANVRHPIRYWHGGADRNIPVAMVRDFVGTIAGAHLQVDETLGHFSLVIQRAPAALDYLAACAADGNKVMARS